MVSHVRTMQPLLAFTIILETRILRATFLRNGSDCFCSFEQKAHYRLKAILSLFHFHQEKCIWQNSFLLQLSRNIAFAIFLTSTNHRPCPISALAYCYRYPSPSLAFRSHSSPMPFSSLPTSSISPSSPINPSISVSACLCRRSLPSTGFRTTPASSFALFRSPTKCSRWQRLDCISRSECFRMPVNAACLILDTCWTDWGMHCGDRGMSRHRAT